MYKLMNDTFKVTIHVVASLDGIIAKPDNSITWFESTDFYEKGIVPADPEGFLKAIDCYVMGSKTYELALELSKSYGWAYGDTPTLVLSHRSLPIERENVEIYAGDLDRLVNDRLRSKYKNVWMVGGAELAREFIRKKLVDEISLSILPILLGEGLLLFDQLRVEQPLHLLEVNAYKSGMVEMRYEVKKVAG